MDKMRLLYGENKIQRAAALSFSLRTFNPFNGISSSPSTNAVLSDNEFEYLLVINPAKNIGNDVRKIKKYFANKYHHPKAEKTQPHITLAVFRTDESKEKILTDAIEETCRHSYPVEIILSNYNYFPSHTLYIDIKNPAAIADIVKGLNCLKDKSELLGTRYYFCNHPQIIIASGLQEEAFLKAKKDFESRTYQNSFLADTITLLKRKNQYDRCTIIKEVELTSASSIAV